MEHFVFLVFIADIPNMYKKVEIRNGDLFGDDHYVCEAFYVQKVVLVSTEKLKTL